MNAKELRHRSPHPVFRKAIGVYWVVRWHSETKVRGARRGSRKYTPRQFTEMLDFMADKIEQVGLHRVTLDRYEGGRRVDGTTLKKRPRATPLTFAERIEDEDFGNFKDIS